MEDTLDDFLQKYKGAFVFIKPGDREILTQFKGLNLDNQKLLEFTNPKLGLIYIKFENAYNQIKIRFPDTGIYNIGKYGFSFFYRHPDRQYKRCPIHGNSILLRVGDNQRQDINFDNMETCFSAKYPETKEAAQYLVGTRGGTALTKQLGVTVSDTHDYDLWFHNKHIGHIHNNRVDVVYQPLLQEAIDFFGKDLVWKTT